MVSLFKWLQFGLKKVQLDTTEFSLVKSLGFSEELAVEIKKRTGHSVEGLYELQQFDDYPEEPKVRGVKSPLGDKLDAPSKYNIVKELQSDTRFKDYHIFSCGEYSSYNKWFFGAIHTSDQFECLRVFETNGINYNLTTEDVIAFFLRWYNEVPFSIIDVHHDCVFIQLAHLNFDLDKFATESIEFCPDFLSVVESVGQMKDYIRERKGLVDFWWD